MPTKPLNEQLLLIRIKRGDQHAFTELYNANKRKVAAALLKLLKSEELTQEVLQDLFLKLWSQRERIDPERAFQPYLYRIAKNMVYDVFRNAARDSRLASHLMSTCSELYVHVEEGLIMKEDRKLLENAINKLPPQRRRVFTLFKLEGKSYKEISDDLGISHDTIKEHIQKAMLFLKKEINPPAAVAASIILKALFERF